jgi:hypothetical protein
MDAAAAATAPPPTNRRLLTFPLSIRETGSVGFFSPIKTSSSD